MSTYKVVILTDSNRKFTEVRVTEGLLETIESIYNFSHSLFSSTQFLTRVVYEENFETKEQAEKRKTEMVSYSRMWTERLIRRSNPNWLNLYPIRPMGRSKAKKSLSSFNLS